ncbi:MAG: nitroreductase family protein [bacterium]
MKEDNMPEEEQLDSLIEIIRHRRSVRKFDPAPVTAEDIAPAAKAALRSPTCGKASSWNIHVFLEPKLKERLRRAVLAGIKGRVNTWMSQSDIPAMVCVTAAPDKAPRKGDKPFYLLESAIAFENFALAARAAGLGTCWIGAFNEAPIIHALELDPGSRVVAVSPLGRPYMRPLSPLDLSGQYDRITRKRLHESRRPLTDIVFSGRQSSAPEWPLTPDQEALSGRRTADMGQSDIIPGLLSEMEFVTAFAKKDVEEAKLNWIFEAARLAPSASNSQVWRFVAIRDKTQLKELECAAHNENGFQVPFSEAPVTIALMAEQWVMRARGDEQPYFMIDVPIALSHMLLMATELGLAANVTLHFNENKVRRAVQAPIQSRAVALLSLGYAPQRGKTGGFPEDMLLPKKDRVKGFEIIS